MNFRKKQPPAVGEREVVIDMEEMAQAMEGPEKYAPPHVRNGGNRLMPTPTVDPAAYAIERVESFGALPTKEIDEVVAAAKAEIRSLEEEAQAVRDLYVSHTTRITSRIKRLREGVRLSMNMMEQLRAQCIALNSENEKTEAEDAS